MSDTIDGKHIHPGRIVTVLRYEGSAPGLLDGRLADLWRVRCEQTGREFVVEAWMLATVPNDQEPSVELPCSILDHQLLSAVVAVADV